MDAVVLCVRVCVCVWEREKKKKDRERGEGDRDGESIFASSNGRTSRSWRETTPPLPYLIQYLQGQQTRLLVDYLTAGQVVAMGCWKKIMIVTLGDYNNSGDSRRPWWIPMLTGADYLPAFQQKRLSKGILMDEKPLHSHNGRITARIFSLPYRV